MSIAMPVIDPPQAVTQEPQERRAANGRLCIDNLSDMDRNYAVAIHLSPLAGFFFPPAVVAPLILWLIRKDQSAYIDDHGREMVNFLISVVVLHLLLGLACLTIIGIPVAVVGIPTIWIVGVISTIRGAIASGRSEYFRYPMTFRFLT